MRWETDAVRLVFWVSRSIWKKEVSVWPWWLSEQNSCEDVAVLLVISVGQDLSSGTENWEPRPRLAARHRDVSFAWTTQKLARLCGVSRSSLASRFTRLVGSGPMEHLQRWRMAVAKHELRRGISSIGEIGLAVGFQSGSAFSTAFTRSVGCSPRQFQDKAK